MFCRLLAALLLVWVCCSSTTAECADLRLRIETAHDLNISESDGAWTIETTGNDPYVVFDLDGPVNTEMRVLDFEYFATKPIRNFSLYYGPPMTATGLVDLPNIPQAEGWHRYTTDLQSAMGRSLPLQTRQVRLDFGMQAGCRIQLRDLSLREFNDRERQAAEQASELKLRRQKSADRISSYLASDYTDRLTSVRVTANQIIVDATFDRVQNDGGRQLVEFPASISIGDETDPASVQPVQTSGDGCHVEIPRYVDGRDRLHSAFAIADAGNTNQLLSARTYATEFSVADAANMAEPPKPDNQKGLGGLFPGPEADLSELGISAVTINLLLNPYVTDDDGPNRERIPVDGPPVYFNADAFQQTDRIVSLARKHDLVVSAIVLIHNPSRASQRSPLVHPDADGGVYAMPDLASSRGTAVYAFVLDRIAQRYRDPTSERGGIANWIAHNEVDFHSVWTNMGEQPRSVATETYYRSLRMIHNAARMYQPHARVFASLTHHWVVADDGLGRQLSPREVIETLHRYSQLEGDFSWGVAYHPYPESLFASVDWNDPSPTDDFDTPLITIQNLPVLGRFLEQESIRDARGAVRPVLLSEQGFHTPDDSSTSQANQAASLLFAMDQVRKLEMVESFHYHRWIDHPDEGGLNLGLRTGSTRENPFGTKKQAWNVYRDIGTPNESKWRETLNGP